MKHIEANNGIKIPMLGYGVFLVKDGEECYNSVRTALEIGYRHIDTASIYKNEESVGKAIKDSGIPREEIFLTTKVWNEVQRSGDVATAFENSLKLLDTDYIDLYLIHWPVPTKYVDTWLTLEKIYQDKKVKAIGVSNFHIHHLEEIKKVWNVVPVMNQIELHPELSQKPIVNFCKENSIIPESWSPLGASKNNLLQNEILISIGEKYKKSPAQIILRWNIDLGIVTIPKSVTPSRIKENFEIFDFELTKEEILKIDSINKDKRVGADPDNFSF
ncbi:MAG: aldo/keto reductase [Defluviitaleaceae bacterium]|nr:aldo/keto reductase [Defluviitaleaceae bacterium]